MSRSSAQSVDPAEIEKFEQLAARWWDPEGQFRPLHRFNPVRLAFIRDRLTAHLGREPEDERPLAGLKLLDLGCGGGLLAEPLTRLGARVTGVDAAEKNIAVARLHAEQQRLAIDYRHATAEDLAERGETFDAVLNMEVVEHVADVTAFMAAAGALVKPSGVMIAATLNRTAKAFFLAIVGAEYLLRWLPRGTHDWRRFLRPSELEAALRAAGLELTELTGVVYNPFDDSWHLAPSDLDVNYMAMAVKRGG